MCYIIQNPRYLKKKQLQGVVWETVARVRIPPSAPKVLVLQKLTLFCCLLPRFLKILFDFLREFLTYIYAKRANVALLLH